MWTELLAVLAGCFVRIVVVSGLSLMSASGSKAYSSGF